MPKAQYIAYRFKTRPSWLPVKALVSRLSRELYLTEGEVVLALINKPAAI